MEKFSISPEAMVPFLQFEDLQAYLESLTIEQLVEWNTKVSQPEAHPDLLVAAIAIHTIESGNEHAEYSEEEIGKMCDSFQLCIGLWHNIKDGHIQMTSGRLKLSDGDRAKFKMTQKGIRHVETKILPRKK